jgi:thiamine-phosphate pyrophosphorylase
MQPDLTPAAARALEAGLARALAGGAAGVEPGHVLLGLLDEDEGRAYLLAAAAGLDAAAYRRAHDRAPAGPPPAGASLPLHPLARSALTQARWLSRDVAGEATVAGEFLLVALLRTDEGLRRALEAHGLRFAELEAAVVPPPAPPLPMDEPLELTGPPAGMDLARVVDAAANRAREALRAAEDYCRFVLNDAFLTGELKAMRHGLAAALAGLAPRALLAARDTGRDVGTALTAPAEAERTSLLNVARANLKRLQEALRSLEEFAKVDDPERGRALEALRYRSYSVEKAVVLGASARERLCDARLYVLLTGSQCARSLEWTLKEAAAGGAAAVQLREKNLGDRELLERARQVRRWARQAGVLFILNDRPDLARLAEADGVHLGQDDLPVKEARRILGPDALVGVSTHDLGQLRQAVLDGASYVGVGPVFPSGSKAFASFPGPAFVRQAAEETTLPAFAIGGINLDTVAEAAAAGARRMAVGQAVAAAESPRAAAAELLRLLAAAGRVGP